MAPPWKGYLAFYKASISDVGTQSTWRRLVDVDEPVYGALAFNAANAAVGLVHSLPHRSTWTTGDYCYLQGLFVAEDGRGFGDGCRLIEHVYQDAYSDEAGRGFRSEAGRHSEAKPATGPI